MGRRVRGVDVLRTFGIVVGLAALCGVAMAGGGGIQAQPASSMSIDVNVAGNGASTLGPVDKCVSVQAGASVTVDVIIEGVPPWVDNAPKGVINPSDKGGITSFSYEFNFPTKMTVSGAPNGPSHEFFLVKNPGSSIFNPSDAAPDSNSPWTATALDTDTKPESGSGVLTRLTMKVEAGIAKGVHVVALSTNVHGDSSGEFYYPDKTNHAAIAVGVPCPAVIPSPSGIPTQAPTPPPTTPTRTLALGETPGPTATPGGTGRPTDGSGTPTGSGGPTNGGTDGPTSPGIKPSATPITEPDDGGGSGWVAVAIGGTLLAVAVGGYVWWRRRGLIRSEPPVEPPV